MNKIYYAFILASIFVSPNLPAQQPEDAWTQLSPWFVSPREHAGHYGEYPDPLRFYDGKKVKTKEDWKRRRREILNRWHGMMGEWPALVTHPGHTVLATTRRENFTQYFIRFNWRPDETTDAYLLVPDTPGKKPAVVCVFYEPETGIGLRKPNLDFAYQLAKRGFVTLSVGTLAEATTRPYAQYYPNYAHAAIQPLSMLGYLAANCWNLLSQRAEVDSNRIGIIGHSYGSKWAMFASCLYDKFACAVWSDGGIVFDNKRPNVNYWDPWYLGYHPPPWSERWTSPERAKGLYPILLKKGHDLTELHALMAPRPFLVSGGSEDPPDRWLALNYAVRVNELLGYTNRVGMTNRADHTPTPGSNEKIWAFFEHFLAKGQGK